MASITIAACSSRNPSLDAETREVDRESTERDRPLQPPGTTVEVDQRVEQPQPRSAVVRAQLEVARALWREADITSYRIEATESRNYWTYGCSWITVVTDGEARQVSDREDDNSCWPRPFTVGDLHETVERLAAMLERSELGRTQEQDSVGGADQLDIVWSDSGVPVSIEFDLIDIADEEMLQTVRFTEAE